MKVQSFSNFKLFMFNNDLILKQSKNEFIKLSNFKVDNFAIEMDVYDRCYKIGVMGLSQEMTSHNDTFDYREELIKEIYKDLKENDK